MGRIKRGNAFPVLQPAPGADVPRYARDFSKFENAPWASPGKLASSLGDEERAQAARILKLYKEGSLPGLGLDFDVWNWSKLELYSLALAMFERLKLLQVLKITDDEFLSFLCDVDRGYLENPYHSFFHAMDVMQIVYHCLTDFGAARYLTRLEVIGLLVAALCHDITHPGVNNLYQVNARTSLAVKYRDASVLENFSCDQTYSLLEKHRLLRNLTPQEGENLKTIIRHGILATDMTFHFDLLDRFSKFVQSFLHTQQPHGGRRSNAGHTPTGREVAAMAGRDLGQRDRELSTSTASMASSAYSSKHNSRIELSVPNSVAGTDPGSGPATTPAAEGSPHHRPAQARADGQPTVSGHVRSGSAASATMVLPPMPEGLTSALDEFGTEVGSDHERLEAAQRQMVVNVLLHGADISNPARPWRLCKKWSDLVVQEFFLQGDLEKLNGLPVSPNMDRDNSNQAQISLGFNDFVVRPFFSVLCEFLPDSRVFISTLDMNRMHWVTLNTPPAAAVVAAAAGVGLNSTSLHQLDETAVGQPLTMSPSTHPGMVPIQVALGAEDSQSVVSGSGSLSNLNLSSSAPTVSVGGFGNAAGMGAGGGTGSVNQSQSILQSLAGRHGRRLSVAAGIIYITSDMIEQYVTTLPGFNLGSEDSHVGGVFTGITRPRRGSGGRLHSRALSLQNLETSTEEPDPLMGGGGGSVAVSLGVSGSHDGNAPGANASMPSRRMSVAADATSLSQDDKERLSRDFKDTIAQELGSDAALTPAAVAAVVAGRRSRAATLVDKERPVVGGSD